jgi:uncharacterized membrane protein
MASPKSALLLTAAVTSALGLAVQLSSAIAADDQAKEKCYGITMAGKNDCASAGNNSCAGTAKGDYEKAAWKFVSKGTCEQVTVTLKDGMVRKGSLTPIKG